MGDPANEKKITQVVGYIEKSNGEVIHSLFGRKKGPQEL